jgi:hypothetical protein
MEQHTAQYTTQQQHIAMANYFKQRKNFSKNIATIITEKAYSTRSPVIVL